ncbi:hypothetical protein Bbelb_395540 [Branchiostoma belcheri]|nr:hypothetical protein Bbelb_395540 [Branchiostoma belcheri]
METTVGQWQCPAFCPGDSEQTYRLITTHGSSLLGVVWLPRTLAVAHGIPTPEVLLAGCTIPLGQGGPGSLWDLHGPVSPTTTLAKVTCSRMTVRATRMWSSYQGIPGRVVCPNPCLSQTVPVPNRAPCLSQPVPVPTRACPNPCLSQTVPVPTRACPNPCLSQTVPIPNRACPKPCLSQTVPERAQNGTQLDCPEPCQEVLSVIDS